VIYSGIELERVRRTRSRTEARAELGLPPGALVIGSLGRLHWVKGYEYLVRALPAVLKELPEAHVVIAGTGPLEAELRELVRGLGLDQQVRFLGFISEVRQLLEASDLYVQCSVSEGLGLAVIEAQGIGLPVVVSRVGGMPETVAEDETGLVVPPNDPHELARAIVRLGTDPDLRKAMGERAHARVHELFTRERMVRDTVAIYDELLGGPGAR
jgi:glycosyltransferase involved in cell wall biosynthesis